MTKKELLSCKQFKVPAVVEQILWCSGLDYSTPIKFMQYFNKQFIYFIMTANENQESETYGDLFLKKLDVLNSFVENRSRICLYIYTIF